MAGKQAMVDKVEQCRLPLERAAAHSIRSVWTEAEKLSAQARPQTRSKAAKEREGSARTQIAAERQTFAACGVANRREDGYDRLIREETKVFIASL